MVSPPCLCVAEVSLGTRPRDRLVDDEDVKKPNKKATKIRLFVL